MSVSFGAIKALSNVTLSINDDSDICGIIGPNGAGKSTLLSVIAGEVSPSGGTVELFGDSNKKKLNPETVNRKGISRTFQIPRPFFGLTVERNIVTCGLGVNNLNDSQEKAKRLLKILELDKHAHSTAGQLNLAGRKRLELAKALMTEPKVLLLDELFEGLNEQEVDSLVNIVKNEIASSSIKVVLVEHVISALRKLANKVYVLNQGELIAEGETEEVLSDEVVIEAYLGKQKV
ncbi:ABC transporter ATP-binding protein [Virgibacillus byunsanensis]|uniref:ABC transporter ATP-binding protein n=1 Tax=Virgibacillus byunsanensis TaxID=570945 RepID=A0ABW3LHG8_9BACI